MANPIFSEKTYQKIAYDTTGAGTMTVKGTVNKIAILMLLTIGSAAVSWFWAASNPGSIGVLAMGGAITGLILCLVISFKQHLAPKLAPIYAVVEGVFLGAFTLLMETLYPTIAISAVLITFGVMAAIIGLYKAGVLRATPMFRKVIFSATAGIALFYLASFLLRFAGINMPLVNDSGLFGIGFSLVVVGLAAFNLVIDLDNIETGAQYGAPKYMEWYCAFGMMVTIIWLYVEILRLLSKLSSRD